MSIKAGAVTDISKLQNRFTFSKLFITKMDSVYIGNLLICEYSVKASSIYA